MLTDFDGGSGNAYSYLIPQLVLSKRIRTRIEVLDRNERVVGEIGQRILDGEVKIDTNAAVTRALSVRLLDRERAMMFVPGSPSAAAIFADTMLRAYRGTYVDAIQDWIDVPVFTGPVTRIERNGPEVLLDCLGKESLAQDPHPVWNPTNIGVGTTLNAALRTMLGLHGEENFHLAETGQKLLSTVSMGKYDDAWQYVLDAATTANLHVFYDGLGRLRTRGWPSGPCYTFKTGEDGNILTPPNFVWDFTIDTGGAANVQEVVVPDPGECFEAPTVTTQYAEFAAPMSPQTLARNSVPRYMVASEEMEGVDGAVARAITARRLADSTRVQQTTDFTTICNPLLEEADMVHVVKENEGGDIRLGQFTIPLGAAAQNIGSLVSE